MNVRQQEDTRWIPQPFAAGLKLVRAALAEAGLSVLAEFDVPGDPAPHSAARQPSRILHVDAPLLDFQAVALDRAPAVFIPWHVLISTDGMRTRVCWANPAAMLDARVPASAAAPLRELQARIAQAVAAVCGDPRGDLKEGDLKEEVGVWIA